MEGPMGESSSLVPLPAVLVIAFWAFCLVVSAVGVWRRHKAGYYAEEDRYRAREKEAIARLRQRRAEEADMAARRRP